MRYNKNKNERETNNKHTFICLKSSKREQLKKRKKKEYNKKKTVCGERYKLYKKCKSNMISIYIFIRHQKILVVEPALPFQQFYPFWY